MYETVREYETPTIENLAYNVSSCLDLLNLKFKAAFYFAFSALRAGQLRAYTINYAHVDCGMDDEYEDYDVLALDEAHAEEQFRNFIVGFGGLEDDNIDIASIVERTVYEAEFNNLILETLGDDETE
jgi:hypothetical protein